MMTDQKGTKIHILQALRIQDGMSRIELSEFTGLSRATISMAVGELIEHNLVYETGEKQFSGGRPKSTLELVPNSKVMIGADYNNKSWTLGAFDLLGNTIRQEVVNVHGSSPEEIFQTLLGEIHKFSKSLPKEPLPLLGLGVPGLVDANYSTIHSVPELGWYNFDVSSLMFKEIGWPVVAVNRHRARGLAECRYGSGQHFHQLIYVGVGSGIAAGLYFDRQLLSGSLGGAGEIGHMTILPDGPLCPCGNHGCLHVLSSGTAIEQQFRKQFRLGRASGNVNTPIPNIEYIKATDICALAEQGDPLACEVISQAGEYLGIALANLANVMNPEAIILGGSVAAYSTLLVEKATSTTRQRANSLSANTIVKVATLTEIGGALGSANFALDQNMAISIFN